MNGSALLVGVCAVFFTFIYGGPAAAQQDNAEKLESDPAVAVQDPLRVWPASTDSVELFWLRYDSLSMDLLVLETMLSMAEVEVDGHTRQGDLARIEKSQALVREFQERIVRLKLEMAPFNERMKEYQERLQRTEPKTVPQSVPR